MDADTQRAISALIQFLIGPLAILFVGWLLDRRSKARIAAVKHEITNNHSKHLREDLDSKFKSLYAKSDYTNTILKKQGRVLVALRNDVSELFDNDTEHAKDVLALQAEIEKVVPGARTPDQDNYQQ